MAKAKIIQFKTKKNNTPKTAKEKNVEEDNAAHYEKLLTSNPLNQKAYHRLMIIYRKEKNYKKELQVINKAIRSFEDFHKANTKKHAQPITALSKSLSKSLGLTDHKGKITYDTEPVATWRKRKEIVLKKISGK